MIGRLIFRIILTIEFGNLDVIVSSPIEATSSVEVGEEIDAGKGGNEDEVMFFEGQSC